jgi:hypothetical protein
MDGIEKFDRKFKKPVTEIENSKVIEKMHPKIGNLGPPPPF